MIVDTVWLARGASNKDIDIPARDACLSKNSTRPFDKKIMFQGKFPGKVEGIARCCIRVGIYAANDLHACQFSAEGQSADS